MWPPATWVQSRGLSEREVEARAPLLQHEMTWLGWSLRCVAEPTLECYDSDDLTIFRMSSMMGHTVAQEVFDADFCAERLKALSDPHRLRIVTALRYGELTVGDIADMLGAEVVNVSHHLKIMKYANLVEVRREGRFMYYRLHGDLQCAKGRGTRVLDLGCCRLEVPDRR